MKPSEIIHDYNLLLDRARTLGKFISHNCPCIMKANRFSIPKNFISVEVALLKSNRIEVAFHYEIERVIEGCRGHYVRGIGCIDGDEYVPEVPPRIEKENYTCKVHFSENLFEKDCPFEKILSEEENVIKKRLEIEELESRLRQIEAEKKVIEEKLNQG